MQTHQVEKRIGARLFAEPRGREPEIAAIMKSILSGALTCEQPRSLRSVCVSAFDRMY